MKISALFDKGVRFAAGLTAFAALWPVLLVSIMAGAAPGGQLIGFGIMAVGYTLATITVACSIVPEKIATLPPFSAGLASLLVRFPVYVVAAAGFAYLGFRVLNLGAR